MHEPTWKDHLHDRMPPDLAHEIDLFEGQMALMRQGKLDEKVFAETRLRRGVYGQRYDNGQRHDGLRTQTLDFPQDLVKGPNTLWDAPGMQRIKIPFGGLTPEQMEVLAQVADAYADGILHVTTRQDFQLHYVHIEDTPDLMRRLAAVGITTHEACGNVVRNVTACPLAGVCHTEAFDVTPYAHAMARFLLGHPDAQDFGRKFKVAFSGCAHTACGLVMMHDLGLLARTRPDPDGGPPRRGFAVYVGGGLGAVPEQAKLLSDFVPEEEILPLAQAIARVFARHGEKKNRNRARIKFLVAQLGIEAFRRLVEEERQVLPPDDRWTAYLEAVPGATEEPHRPPLLLDGDDRPDGFDAWYATNVYHQRQPGYCVATIHLPLGDLTARQMIALADLARRYAGGHVRTTVEQNIVFRWVAEADLPALYRDLKALGLGEPGAGTIVDITACPGTDTCKLGIASSRGLAGELITRLTARRATLPEPVRNLRIKVSGCFNSCGQHHVADIGFFGNSRKSGNYRVPYFQVVLGGQWQHNAGQYGMAIGSVPARLIPDVVDTLTTRYVEDHTPGESFQDWVKRLGKAGARELIRPFMITPVYEEQPAFFSDWGDPRVFTLGDLGVGECAGEVVSLFAMEISKAESELFEAQEALDRGDFARADARAYQAMLMAARALVRTEYLDVGEDPDRIVEAFRARFYDTERFFDPFARGKFARYLFSRHEHPPARVDEDAARRIVDEAQLFIEATHACEMRMSEEAARKAEEARRQAARNEPRREVLLPPGFAS
ncbi:hypothetical protein GQ464_004600 [Rhodocaloribacter litoris]|uniref:nitrite/sulfite reductase n=1 Tax=Rhodocaloribacter litoris TaxID=2558931 RepID=UPI00141E4DC8|nr:nitrite/sulfite reductase [Rhodocaloribacter litoris]QXD16238.1 hypothetical protein GQ464_004600 [Rhodocaloribacter litoris]